MSTKLKWGWEEKYRQAQDKVVPLQFTEEGTVDFFVSLHQEEIKKAVWKEKRQMNIVLTALGDIAVKMKKGDNAFDDLLDLKQMVEEDLEGFALTEE